MNISVQKGTKYCRSSSSSARNKMTTQQTVKKKKALHNHYL